MAACLTSAAQPRNRDGVLCHADGLPHGSAIRARCGELASTGEKHCRCQREKGWDALRYARVAGRAFTPVRQAKSGSETRYAARYHVAFTRNAPGRVGERGVFSDGHQNGKLCMRNLEEARIAIVGLGYVGLPLAVEFGKHYKTTGFDINVVRVDALRAGRDATLEVDAEELAAATHLRFSAQVDDLRDCNVYIVTVPTPIDSAKRPDLTPLIRASETLGKVLKRGDIVVYESTVYPGCTEEVCVPILARVSGLAFNEDFFAAYSPERINPGDKLHRVTSILKVT
jgi:UDP-glucose/GDP-mannose dehydrogenase family protein